MWVNDGMTRVISSISVSLDGYVAGPDPTMQDPLGKRGELLHEWVIKLQAWREPHKREGGTTDDPSEAVVRDQLEATGSYLMGRRMYSGGSGPWSGDGNANGWWGDEPPFRLPVYVLTHHEREPLTLGQTTFHFATTGVEDAVAAAREAAGDKAVHVSGGAEAIGAVLAAGLLDELEIHLVPILLGSGARLFEGAGTDPRLELVRVVDAPDVTHLKYAVSR
jgi:dihydrofolate reductase